jgi:hypothetical protein
LTQLKKSKVQDQKTEKL